MIGKEKLHAMISIFSEIGKLIFRFSRGPIFDTSRSIWQDGYSKSTKPHSPDTERSARRNLCLVRNNASPPPHHPRHKPTLKQFRTLLQCPRWGSRSAYIRQTWREEGVNASRGTKNICQTVCARCFSLSTSYYLFCPGRKYKVWSVSDAQLWEWPRLRLFVIK